MASNFKSNIRYMITRDPGLPRKEPTQSAWQQPPHPKVSNIQSTTLGETTDIAVIGSGITGCSVTKTLLEDASLGPVRITVLEARSLVSGATGRNGGNLVSTAGQGFADLVSRYGIENARQMVRFSLKNIERVQEVARGLPKDIQERSEIRPVEKVIAVADNETWERHKASLAFFEKEIPERKGHHFLVSKEELAEKYGMINAVGAISQKGGVLWPYRLFTDIFHHLLQTYPDRLTIETHTPVTCVEENPVQDGYGYLIITPRGTIKAKKVVYCTNGHTAHVLPLLRGKIYPFRGHMSMQNPGPNFPDQGNLRSWSLAGKVSLDPETGNYYHGLSYVQQNSKTKMVFAGGEYQNIDELFHGDDTEISQISKKDLIDVLPHIFSYVDPNKTEKSIDRPQLVMIWSGIQGHTPDGLPLVDRLPANATGRKVGQEWIAAGFNGYGMDKCWMTGEALAAMIAGQTVDDVFPLAYMISDERIQSDMSITKVEDRFYDVYKQHPKAKL